DMCVSLVWYAPLRTGTFSHDRGRKSTRISRFPDIFLERSELRTGTPRALSGASRTRRREPSRRTCHGGTWAVWRGDSEATRAPKRATMSVGTPVGAVTIAARLRCGPYAAVPHVFVRVLHGGGYPIQEEMFDGATRPSTNANADPGTAGQPTGQAQPART